MRLYYLSDLSIDSLARAVNHTLTCTANQLLTSFVHLVRPTDAILFFQYFIIFFFLGVYHFSSVFALCYGIV